MNKIFLEEFCDYQKGFAFKSKDYATEGTRIIKVSDLNEYNITLDNCVYIKETKNPVFSMLSSVKCRNSQEINDFSTLSDTLFYPLSQNQKYLQSGFHPNPEGYRKSTVRLDNC